MATTACTGNCSDAEVLYDIVSNEMWIPWTAALDYFEYQPWFFSLLGSIMVGLSGVFPLLIIPIDESVNLTEGAGAETLKLLLSFAVGGLLGDVFLHLLPEAWANNALSKVGAKGHPSMACGLWVLAGFLVFIVAEKMFVGATSEEEKEEKEVAQEPPRKKNVEALNNNNNDIDAHHKVLENNNCMKAVGDCPKNGFCMKEIAEMRALFEANPDLKNCYVRGNNGFKSSLKEECLKNCYGGSVDVLKDGRRYGSSGILTNSLLSSSMSNGFSRNSLSKANGFAKYLSDRDACFPKSAAYQNGYALRNRVANEEVTEIAPRKDKPKHISGYLNLIANCIDNFTHGLAVGGSFLVSFRLGALTTLAILVHEIPHEVGDFAILLKSGFNRWDAAKAQLMTATGGIFGALVAVMFSGGGVEARTGWILPFTAGGFLHIGLVTVLPELLQESNPKESLKQLGALLIGISLMALLTTICD